MKKIWTVVSDFFCAVVFVLCAWEFGVARGMRTGSAYYVFLGLVWLAGAVIWGMRGVRAMKMTKDHAEL